LIDDEPVAVIVKDEKTSFDSETREAPFVQLHRAGVRIRCSDWSGGAPVNDDQFHLEILGDGPPSPTPRPAYKDLSESLRYAGFHHACLQLDDVEATVAKLRRRGATIVTEPFVLPVIERRLAFFSDPFGNLFELTEVLDARATRGPRTRSSRRRSSSSSSSRRTRASPRRRPWRARRSIRAA